MTLTTDRMADALTRTEVAFAVQAHNVGERPIYAALRPRQVSFEVHGPDGTFECARASGSHHIPRELYGVIDHGKHVHLPVRLAELCPTVAFTRPGLYAVVPTLTADGSGDEYEIAAVTGTITTRDRGTVRGTHDLNDDATLVRIRRGARPFYSSPPVAVPTHSR
ncbi:MAG: hypothetical protein EXR75_11910 [Myxococcales bacterium]|nr:hypothetical protein [Myxococcales bacterium]